MSIMGPTWGAMMNESEFLLNSTRLNQLTISDYFFGNEEKWVHE